jgi:hypothetical protein
MEQYGFVVPGNPFDRVDFDQHGQHAQQQQLQQLWMSHTAVKQAAQQVKQQLAQCHQQAAAGAAAAADALHFTAAHVDAAVASIITAAGWTNLRQYKQVTPGSTLTRAQQLLASVQAQLTSFPTSIAEDQLLLQQINRRLRRAQLAWKVRPGSSSSHTAVADSQHVADRRLSAAVQYRLERKVLLEAAMHVLQAVQDDWRSSG